MFALHFETMIDWISDLSFNKPIPLIQWLISNVALLLAIENQSEQHIPIETIKQFLNPSQ
jgi:hypothetical protein